MKVAAIIQARMGSTRLPGKILKEVLGKPLLVYQIERIKRAKNIDEIVIATTIKENDDAIVEFCKTHGISYYRGSEEDVLSRYYEAAKQINADVVIRLTSDCPLIDPLVIEQIVDNFLNSKDEFDYVSNTLERSYPRGMDTEVFSYATLQEIHNLAVGSEYREHVTPYIYSNPEQYRLKNISYSKDLSDYRLTVDTQEDFLLIKNLIEYLTPIKRDFSLEDIVEVLEEFPEWKHINAHIEQKKLSVGRENLQ